MHQLVRDMILRSIRGLKDCGQEKKTTRAIRQKCGSEVSQTLWEGFSYAVLSCIPITASSLGCMIRSRLVAELYLRAANAVSSPRDKATFQEKAAKLQRKLTER